MREELERLARQRNATLKWFSDDCVAALFYDGQRDRVVYIEPTHPKAVSEALSMKMRLH